MSFREKCAWIGLVSVLIAFGAYFGAIATQLISGRGMSAIHLLLGCVALFALLQGGLTYLAARSTPAAERHVRDERELVIQARSHTLGYYVLVVLVLALAVPAHLGHPMPDLMNFALLDVVVASLVVAIAQIVMFRWGGAA